MSDPSIGSVGGSLSQALSAGLQKRAAEQKATIDAQLIQSAQKSAPQEAAPRGDDKVSGSLDVSP